MSQVSLGIGTESSPLAREHEAQLCSSRVRAPEHGSAAPSVHSRFKLSFHSTSILTSFLCCLEIPPVQTWSDRRIDLLLAWWPPDAWLPFCCYLPFIWSNFLVRWRHVLRFHRTDKVDENVTRLQAESIPGLFASSPFPWRSCWSSSFSSLLESQQLLSVTIVGIRRQICAMEQYLCLSVYRSFLWVLLLCPQGHKRALGVIVVKEV